MSVLFNSSRTKLQHVRIFAPGGSPGTPGGSNLPGPVSNVTASDVGPNAFKLNYPAASNATSYEYSLNGGPWLSMPAGSVITGLLNQTTYTVEVRGVNGNGAGGASSPISVLTSTLGLFWDPSKTSAGASLSNNNRTFTGDTGAWETTYTTSSFPKNTKIYAEFEYNSNGNVRIGLTTSNTQNYLLDGTLGPSFVPYSSNIYYTDDVSHQKTGIQAGQPTTALSGFIMIAWDGDRFYVGRDGTWLNGDPASHINGQPAYVPGNEIYFSAVMASMGGTITGNFGAYPFRYTPPAGYPNYQAPTLPGAITNFLAVGVTQTSITVSFNPDPNSTSYEMSRDGGPFLPVQIGDTISGLSNDTDYKLTIRGVNAFGYGPETPIWVRTVGEKPGDMGNMTVTDITATTVRLVFSDVVRADYYEYWVGQAYNDFVEWKRLDSDRIVKGLEPNTSGYRDPAGSLYAAVRGVNAVGKGRYDISEPFNIGIAAPAKVMNVAVTEITATSARVTFTPAQYATQRYQYTRGSNIWNVLPSNGVITGLSEGTSYTIQVVGVNGWGPGPASDPVTFTAAAVATTFTSFDPAKTGDDLRLSNQNLTVSGTANTWNTTIAKAGYVPSASKKLYAEFMMYGSSNRVMLVKDPYDFYTVTENYVSFYLNGQLRIGKDQYYHNNQLAGTGTNDRNYIGMLWDGSAVSFLINGTPINIYFGRLNGNDPISPPYPTTFSTAAIFGTPGSSSTIVYPAVAFFGMEGSVTSNFGGSPWKYQPPAGYEGWAA